MSNSQINNKRYILDVKFENPKLKAYEIIVNSLGHRPDSTTFWGVKRFKPRLEKGTEGSRFVFSENDYNDMLDPRLTGDVFICFDPESSLLRGRLAGQTGQWMGMFHEEFKKKLLNLNSERATRCKHGIDYIGYFQIKCWLSTDPNDVALAPMKLQPSQPHVEPCCSCIIQ